MYIEWNKILVKLGNFSLKMDLSLKKAELVTLLGPSGCGKTTALRVAAGFITPDSGDFIIDGINMNTIPVPKRNVGIVFQNYALFPHLNVEQNISYGLKSKKLNPNNIKDEVEYILESLHLKNYNKRDINSLSGGEKQRVALGRSLAIKPRLLLLDEPLSALDADLKKRLRIEIKSIQREFKITTLYVTHDQEEALAVSDRIALLKDGVIQQLSTPEELYKNPCNKFVGEFIGESNYITINNNNYFFRPESVRPGHSDNSINFNGKIIKSEYAGHFSRAILKCDNGVLIKVISYNHLHEEKYHVNKSNLILM